MMITKNDFEDIMKENGGVEQLSLIEDETSYLTKGHIFTYIENDSGFDEITFDSKIYEIFEESDNDEFFYSSDPDKLNNYSIMCFVLNLL